MLRRERVPVGTHQIDVHRQPDLVGKQVVVMIHGIGVSGRYLLPFASLLTPEYDVRVLDLPGYGKTPAPDHALSPVELAEVTVDYMTQEKISNAVIIGQSMGCQTAVHTANQAPGLCKTLLLIGPTTNKSERSIFMQAIRLFQDTLREPFKVNCIIFYDYARMGIIRYLKTTRFLLHDHIEDHLPKVTIPICIVRGSNDPIAPRKWLRYLVSRNKQAVMREVDDAPHNPQFTKPKELYGLCRDFLNA